jgi:hypothetical protein
MMQVIRIQGMWLHLWEGLQPRRFHATSVGTEALSTKAFPQELAECA